MLVVSVYYLYIKLSEINSGQRAVIYALIATQHPLVMSFHLIFGVGNGLQHPDHPTNSRKGSNLGGVALGSPLMLILLAIDISDDFSKSLMYGSVQSSSAAKNPVVMDIKVLLFQRRNVLPKPKLFQNNLLV